MAGLSIELSERVVCVDRWRENGSGRGRRGGGGGGGGRRRSRAG